MRQLQIRKEDCIGVLPYRALGTECGILKIYRIDEVAVFDSGGTKRAHPAVVAEAGEGLLTNRRYQMIVNPGIMESW